MDWFCTEQQGEDCVDGVKQVRIDAVIPERGVQKDVVSEGDDHGHCVTNVEQNPQQSHVPRGRLALAISDIFPLSVCIYGDPSIQEDHDCLQNIRPVGEKDEVGPPGLPRVVVDLEA